MGGSTTGSGLRLVWASPDLERLLGSPPNEDAGYGLHLFEACNREVWQRIATPRSRRLVLERPALAISPPVINAPHRTCLFGPPGVTLPRDLARSVGTTDPAGTCVACPHSDMICPHEQPLEVLLHELLDSGYEFYYDDVDAV